MREKKIYSAVALLNIIHSLMLRIKFKAFIRAKQAHCHWDTSPAPHKIYLWPPEQVFWKKEKKKFCCNQLCYLLGIEPRALFMVAKCSTIELHPPGLVLSFLEILSNIRDYFSQLPQDNPIYIYIEKFNFKVFSYIYKIESSLSFICHMCHGSLNYLWFFSSAFWFIVSLLALRVTWLTLE